MNIWDYNAQKAGLGETTDLVLDPVWPNAGVEIAYYHNLADVITEMHSAFMVLVASPEFRRDATLAIGLDAKLFMLMRAGFDARRPKSPAQDIQAKLDVFAKRWQGKWDSMETRIATKFASGAWTTTDNGVRASFAKAGFTLKFKPTKPMLLAYNARIQTNVNLIRTIPQQYLKDVSQKVWDVVTTTGDLNKLTNDIQAVYGVTTRRAALIARDQNAKAKASFEETRRMELGIEEAEWQHSAAGQEQYKRPTHVKAGAQRTRYNIKQGWFDPAVGKYIWPGTEISCRCSSRAIIPGLRRRKS